MKKGKLYRVFPKDLAELEGSRELLLENVQQTESWRERSRGLLGQPALEKNEGLLITPCNSVHTFGMRYPLDIVYLDKKMRIVKINRSLSPWRLSISLRAAMVLELAAGRADELLLKFDDVLLWKSEEK